MNKNQFINLFLLFFFLIGCDEKWQNSLKGLDKSRIYGNSYKDWHLVQIIENQFGSKEYTIEKSERDTSKILSFTILAKDGEVIINSYRKKFRCNKQDTCFLKMLGKDTLYYYHQRDGKKFFDVGEYAYKFTYIKLKSEEVDFYLKHEDSLRKIRGTNLPMLPRGSDR